MDVNTLGTVQPASTNSNRSPASARETLRADSGSTATESDSTQLSVPASFGDSDEQPDPATPRGSLLDISV